MVQIGPVEPVPYVAFYTLYVDTDELRGNPMPC
jgi:hypothetical protein